MAADGEYTRHGRIYTHRGWAFGFVPVYTNLNGDEVAAQTDFWEYAFDICDFFFSICVMIRQSVNEDFEHPGWPVKVVVGEQEINQYWWYWRIIGFFIKVPDRAWGCPHCGYENCSDHKDLFVEGSSGTSFHPDFGDIHWWEGMQTCWRCGHEFPYGDQDK